MTAGDAAFPRALSRSELERQVAEIVTQVGGKPVTEVDAELADLGFDSLALLDLLAALELRFQIELTEDVISEFRTVARVSRVVRDADRR
jgi:acyl carrier protein